jgi:hypothetical protein
LCKGFERQIAVHAMAACGKVGWVDTRLAWGEVVDFAKGVTG